MTPISGFCPRCSTRWSPAGRRMLRACCSTVWRRPTSSFAGPPRACWGVLRPPDAEAALAAAYEAAEPDASFLARAAIVDALAAYGG